MDGNAQTELNLLGRIVALLLALADLADRAGARPHPVRCRVLGFLYRAEAAAHAGLCGVARHLGAPASPQAVDVAPSPGGDSPSDAAFLALRLRALALVWTGLLAWLQKVARRRTRHGVGMLLSALAGAVDLTEMLRFKAAWPYVDTS